MVVDDGCLSSVLHLALLTVTACVDVLGTARTDRVRGIWRAGEDERLFVTRKAS